jgi:hypothetical protein
MPFPVLVGIGVVPVKPEAILQRIHCCHKSSIRPSYTSRPASAVNSASRTWPHYAQPVELTAAPDSCRNLLGANASAQGVRFREKGPSANPLPEFGGQANGKANPSYY